MVRTTADVIVDARKEAGAAEREALVRTFPPVAASLRGQARVHNVDDVALGAGSHEEILRLDIAMEQVLCVDVLESSKELVGDEEDGFERKGPVAVVEQVLKRGPEEVYDKDVEVIVIPKPPDTRDSHSTGQRCVRVLFVAERRRALLVVRELEGNLVTPFDVGPYVHNEPEPSQFDLEEAST